MRPEAVALVRERLAAARGQLQEVVHVLDEAGVFDEDDRLTLGALGVDLERATGGLFRALSELVELRLFLGREERRVMPEQAGRGEG